MVDDCIKRNVFIMGKKYYLTVGKNFASITVPRENDPNISNERMLLESITTEITKLLEEINKDESKTNSTKPD